MAAVASSGHDRDSSFVGQVFQKGSPILTWRPTRVLRVPTPMQTIELDMADIEEVPESTIQRVSRMPTRRVVAWPVVPNIERGAKARSQAWSIAAHVTIALVLACGMALGIVALDVEGAGVARAAQPLRDGTAHVMETTVDTLANTPLEPPSVVAPAVAPAPARKSASSHATSHGRARPALQAHPATHAAHRPARTAHKAR
ncbi:MAG TPA: hypothetical protein VGI39_43660 [Polyangiaceae bacterium]|jgi:hypothetical protein